MFFASQANALSIEFRNLGGAEAGAQALAGFQAAAHFWETVLTNDITVKLNVGFSALGTGILGSTGSTTDTAYIGQVLPALQASGDSALDAVAAANLPDTRPSSFTGGQAVDALISAPRADGAGVALPLSRVLDADASANNSTLSANTSLMKALGLTPTYTGANAAIMADGSVTFSSAFNWDFDPTNGISNNQIDFIGVAIHEIGHALGFRSGVDTYDLNTGFAADIGDFAVMSIWDLFRYSQDSIALGVNDWAIGGAGSSAPFFSIDGQTIYNSNAFLSTGAFHGDGRQASHWKDNLAGDPQLGAFDPTVAFGQQTIVTSLDLAAFDAMGWNIGYDVMARPDRVFSTRDISRVSIPEPATWALLIGGFFMMGGLVRARRRASLGRPLRR